MRKIIALMLIIALTAGGCHNMMGQDEEPLVVFASFYPIYTLLRDIVVDVPDLTVECLTQPLYGCLRDYELSNWDVAKLSVCDVLVIGGRGLESFEGGLEGAGFGLIKASQALELLGEDEVVPEGDDELSHFTGPNPWAWLGVDTARGMYEAMAAAMAVVDSRYKDIYSANLKTALENLDELEGQMLALMPEKTPRVAIMHEGLEYIAYTLDLDVVCEIDRESGEDMDADALSRAAEDIASSGADIALIERCAPQSLVEALRGAGVNLALIDTITMSNADYVSGMLENARAIAEAIT